MRDAYRDPTVGLILVGFSPGDRLAALARHLGWPGRVLSDPDRTLYQRLGVGRAPLWQVYNMGTLARYAVAALSRERPRRAVEDTRQLGADAILVNGSVKLIWRPRSPDDRPAAAAVHDAAEKYVR